MSFACLLETGTTISVQPSTVQLHKQFRVCNLQNYILL